MKLHNDKELFDQYLFAVADYMGLDDRSIVEKDYYVTLFLKNIVEKQPNVVFKGGTSLSKCYKIIKRFSENIDLSVETEREKLSEGQRKQLKKDIMSIVNKFDFTLINPEQVRSRRDYNHYIIGYNPMTRYKSIKQNLIVETAVYIKAFPSDYMNVTSYVYDFLVAKGFDEEIQKYSLEPFQVKVLSIERTFIDKVFALGDYYLTGNVDAHSRHLYDLHKLFPGINMDNRFEMLVAEVREIRKSHSSCYSAQNGIDLKTLLKDIVTKAFYKTDYNRITQPLLFEQVTYEESIDTLKKIIDEFPF